MSLLYHSAREKSRFVPFFSDFDSLTQKKQKFALYRLKKMCYNNKIENIVAFGRIQKAGKDELLCILWALSVQGIWALL